MELFYILLVLLLTARGFAEIAVRFGQPELLGEIIAGIVLGMILNHYGHQFPILSELESNSVFAAVKDLGIFFLLLMGGIELRPRDMANATKGGIVIGSGGIVLPFILASLFGFWFLPDSQYKTAQILFLGTALSVTAVPVAIKVLMDMGKLDSRMGQVIVSAAVIDDVLSLALLAMLTAIIQTGAMMTGMDLVLLIGKVVLFFLVTSVVGFFVFPAIGNFLQKTMADEFEFSMLLTAAFAYAILAEALGMHFILGAFQAGLFFRKSTISKKSYENIQNTIKGMTNGFLAPVFFVSVGLHLNLAALTVMPEIVLGLIVIAVLGKLLGSGVAAKFFGFSWQQASGIGVAMNARGAVELVIADIAFRAGVFSHPDPAPPIVANLYSAVVIMAVVTTVITPPLLQLIFNQSESRQ